MRKVFGIMILMFGLVMTGCSKTNEIGNDEGQASTNEQAEQVVSEDLTKQIKLRFENQEIIVRLENNAYANELYNRLPLELEFEDFNQTEVIGYLETPLTTQENLEGYDPVMGDFAYYEPWGNISIFYKDFRHSDDLFLLGKIIDSQVDLSSINGKVIIEKMDRKEKN